MPNTTQQDLSFLTKCTAVRVAFGNLSFSKKLPRATVTTMVTSAEQAQPADDGQGDAQASVSDPGRISASKRLLDCDEAEAIKSEFSRIKKFIKERTLPSPFGDGIYFVPNTLIEEVYNQLVAAETYIPMLGEALIAVYDSVLEREAIALGSNFSPIDYDTPTEIRSRLKVDYAMLTFGIPEHLPNAMYQREQQKANSKLSEAVDTMQALLRGEFAKLVEHAAEKLSGKKDDGKPLVFRNSLITNIQEFLTLFRDRNITGDKDLEAMCDRVKHMLDGVDPADLREKEPLRDSLARGFADIRASLDTMMVPKASRVITFADEAVQETAAA